MGPMRETKMQTSGSKDALKEMLARPGSGEPDDALNDSALQRVFGRNLPNLDDVEKNNARVLLKSGKGWSDDDVHDLATNPPGRLQRNVEMQQGGTILNPRGTTDALTPEELVREREGGTPDSY